MITMYQISDMHDTQTVFLCDRCAHRHLPIIGGNVRAYECDQDIECESCTPRNDCGNSAINAGTNSGGSDESDNSCHPSESPERATERNR